ncbi:DUF4962 domain-containing protein [Bythopirellula goksoeyrii]|uniref:Heparinase II/III-like protein n=1 Tax=Bythopirellula goksoeyrii TaxID=1400387 RepID=A0A5B9QQ75_9BACT|nr:DUF4962 domain-containing protein [Bythopirellula goksoeyrii]QEG36281.1 Heparinase II/III-like protein [Bythopirellula goksoeyrii]
MYLISWRFQIIGFFFLSASAFAEVQDISTSAIIPRADLVWTTGLPIVERDALDQELIAYPIDGDTAGVNPPGFCWTPHEAAKRYRIEVSSKTAPDALIIVADRQLSTVYPPTKLLMPGDYRWQVVYLNEFGRPWGLSKTRCFRIGKETPILVLPNVAKLRKEIVGVRPRLFLVGDRPSTIRKEIDEGRVDHWEYFLSAANGAIDEKPYAEPEGYANNSFNESDWRRILKVGKVGSAHLARTALAYQLTGDRKYLVAARKWMMNLASWDPRGIISHDIPLPGGAVGNDEASMALLERMAFAWDWIGDELLPEERERILEVMTERGNQVLAVLHQQDFLSHPFSNHEGRSLAFLGHAGLSFLGDIPEADDWLDYVLRCYLTSYPCWGGDDGGWAQGTSYGSSYVYRHSTFAEALCRVTDVDILRRPFYKNHGYFSLYFHPPYAPMNAFGDGGNKGQAEKDRSVCEKSLIDFLANTFCDSVLKWHAQSINVPSLHLKSNLGNETNWNEQHLEDLFSLLRAGTYEPNAEMPVPTVVTKLLPNIGWAAMHSAFGDADNDVWVLFKSSRFGSFSHSHADQNTFQFHAFGEALAIDSGYYPYYGDPHHALWTQQTLAHNGILVNGRGQATKNWNAIGSIEHYERSNDVTIVRGEASSAYNQSPNEEIAKMWQEHLGKIHPPILPKVEKFERTLAFVASAERPILVVYDYLKSAHPTSYDWLLHTLSKMEVEPMSGSIVIRQGKARAAVRIVASQPITFSQTNKFTIPSGGTTSHLPRQWHLTAHTKNNVEEAKFCVVFVPFREGEVSPSIKVIERKNTVRFQVGKTSTAVWWGPGELGEIDMCGRHYMGRIIVQTASEL